MVKSDNFITKAKNQNSVKSLHDFMSHGVAYEGVVKQWESIWYGGVDKHDTVGRVDIDRMKALILKHFHYSPSI